MGRKRTSEGSGIPQGGAIRLESVSRVYRDFWGRRKTWALRDLDLEVAPGEIFGLLGPNGSGKTTALKVIVGLLRVTSGRATVLGRRPGDVRALARIGYMPEEPAHYGFLTGLESLEFYGKLFGMARGERKKRAGELFSELGFEAQGRRPVREYSRGMARRLAIAQALVNRPDLLVLDEPTSGLDPEAHRIVTDIFVRLRDEGKSILISSHLLSDIEKVCDRIAILGGGRLLVTGSVTDLLDDPDSIECQVRGIDGKVLRGAIEGAGGEVISSRPGRQTLDALFLSALRKRRKE